VEHPDGVPLKIESQPVAAPESEVGIGAAGKPQGSVDKPDSKCADAPTIGRTSV
jgi:hypothetical protein